MRKYINTATGIVLLCGLFAGACVKPPEQFDPRDGNIVYNGCRVKQIISQGSKYTPGFTREFAYNNQNDPVSVTVPNAGTGNPNLIFRYDNRGRLIEYSGLYTNGGFEFMHTYGYRNNRIVTDTTRTLGAYSNPAGAWSKRYKYLSYDNLNRVVQDSEVYITPVLETVIWQYAYDATGNLVKNVGYDNKLNPHRTNKVWMFTDRNYSVNNEVGATSYNSAGLPLTFSATGPFSYVFANMYYYGEVNYVYDCK